MDRKQIERFLQRVLAGNTREVLLIYLDSIDQMVAEQLEVIIPTFRETYREALLFSDESLLQVEYQAAPLKATRHFLGATTKAVLLDIRQGFPLDYFLSIAATIGAQGVLLLLATDPLGEKESRRFHDVAISTPYFDRYLSEQLVNYAYRYRKGSWYSPQFGGRLAPLMEQETSEEREILASPIKETVIPVLLTEEQRVIYNRFLAEKRGVFTLFSPRGSGKSALGAALISSDPGKFILTAPNQLAIEQYQDIKELNFRAPDALFLGGEKGDFWGLSLIIEEAAKMPLSHLERLVKRFQKVLMISSVENYEGTGQGLREKLYNLVPIKEQYQLQSIHRFDYRDPLAQLADALMFMRRSHYSLNTPFFIPKKADLQESLEIELYDNRNIMLLRQDREKLAALYHLLNQTHYQTNIQDLRRLFDSPNQLFALAFYRSRLIGATWGIEEGGLSKELADAVFRGERRPRGNLVPQILAGQSYFPEAMEAHSVRISRISVESSFRRLGIGARMISAIEKALSFKLDFISVSFGLTADLLAFWRSLGFQPAHLGFHLDKTTGLYSLVVLKQVSDRCSDWIEESYRKFSADAALSGKQRTMRPEIIPILETYAKEGVFDSRDVAVIEAYKNFRRVRYSVENALYREALN